MHYVENNGTNGGLLLYAVNTLNILNLINWKKLTNINKNNIALLTFVNFGTCIWNSFISIDGTIAVRLSSFFLIFSILLIPSYLLIYNYKRTKILIYICCSMLFIISFALNFYGYYYKGLHMSNVPYQVFFLNPSDIFNYR